jgi:dihydrofolate synthase/folylpolyglutamate synthase
MNVKEYLDSFINYEFHLDPSFRTEIKLDRTRELLKRLGNPQDKLRIIHVAGSKGKGSTCLLTATILKEAGFKVGLYTSPHIENYRERIRILNKSQHDFPAMDVFPDSIPEQELTRLLKLHKPLLEVMRLTKEFGRLSFFEIFTALALYYFAEQKVDFVVLETGLGGRLDATNVVSAMVSAITSISLEHTHILGNSIREIAGEKAAIIKSDSVKVVIAPQVPEAHEVMMARCREFAKEPLNIQECFQIQLIQSRAHGQYLNLKTKNSFYADLFLKLLGEHQRINAATAIGIVESMQELGVAVSKLAVYEGFKKVFWPGRFEIVRKDPYVILDGAHNQDSCRVLMDTLQEILPNQKTIFIVGFSKDKDVEGIACAINNKADVVIVTKAHHPRALAVTKERAQQLFKGKNVFLSKNIEHALELAFQQASIDHAIVVTGSLFVVSEARSICQLSQV